MVCTLCTLNFLQESKEGYGLILDRVKEYIIQIKNDWNEPRRNSDDTEGILVRLERLFHHILTLEMIYNGADLAEIMRNLQLVISAIQEQSLDKQVLRPTFMYSGKKGAPKFEISKEQLEYFVENGFTIPQMSNMLNVSCSTIKRRFREYSLTITQTYSMITDQELDKKVEGYLKEFPNTGYKRMRGFLISENIRIQEQRIRECMRRVDPQGVILRSLQSRPILRRKYSVKGPLSLWHMDGNHKLIM